MKRGWMPISATIEIGGGGRRRLLRLLLGGYAFECCSYYWAVTHSSVAVTIGRLRIRMLQLFMRCSSRYDKRFVTLAICRRRIWLGPTLKNNENIPVCEGVMMQVRELDIPVSEGVMMQVRKV